MVVILATVIIIVTPINQHSVRHPNVYLLIELILL